MRNIKLAVTLVCCMIVLVACTSGAETDYAAAIMVNDQIYYLSVSAVPGEIDENAIIGYTKSYTETFPKKNGETNFNRELCMPYAKVEGGMAVLYEDEWCLCVPAK